MMSAGSGAQAGIAAPRGPGREGIARKYIHARHLPRLVMSYHCLVQTTGRLCPFCRTVLERGYLELKSSLLSFLGYGWSYLILTFTGNDGYELEIVKPTERTVTFLCPSCSAAVITNEPWIQ
jgi:hypothetical protein